VFYFFTREAYFTSLALSAGLTLATVWLLIRMAPSLWSASLGLTILLLSRAFLDYSTSGLENAPTNFLLVLFFRHYLGHQRQYFVTAVLTALLLLNRADLALLVLPSLIAALPRTDDPRGQLAVVAGLAPLLLWECFSVLYYGFPVPNTAYAKLK